MPENNLELIYSKQQTVRLSKPEWEFVAENYEYIAETTEKIPFSKFFIQSIVAATSRVKAKTEIKEVSKQTDLETIETLKNEIEQLKISAKEDFEQYTKEISELKEILNSEKENANINPETILLNFSPEWRKYIWGVLEVYKNLNKEVDTYEKLIQLIFKAVNTRGELKLEEKDYQYLDTLDYPFTEPEHKEDTPAATPLKKVD